MSQSIRNAFIRPVLAAVLTTLTISGGAARAEQPGAKEESADAAKEVPLLEVLSFEQMSTLAPEARLQYMDGLRELVTDLSLMDAGSDYEFFGGSDLQATYGALDGWRGGYYVLNRAFVDAAYAQTAPKAAEPELTLEQKAKKRTLDSYRAARAKVIEAWTPDRTWTIKGGAQKVSKGILGGSWSLDEWNKGREAALEKLKQEYKEGYTYSKIDDLEKESPKPKPYTMPEVQKIVEQKKQASKGSSDLVTVCPSPDVKCSGKRSKADMKKMAEARKDKCIYGGIMSSYEGSENSENRKPGRCKRPGPMKFGGLTVSCEGEKKNVILCNPVLFDAGEVYTPGMTKMKGLCVPASQTATVDCEIKAKAKFAQEEELKKKNMPMGKRFWENEQIPGIAEEVNKIAREVNQTCTDDRVRQAQCRECGAIQRNLSHTNLYAKNCQGVPLPPQRPAEFKPHGTGQLLNKGTVK